MNKTKSSQGKIKANPNAPSVIGKPANVQEGIDRIVFREILHNTFDIVAENMLMDRIFCVWDKANYGLITLEAWLHGLSLFLKGSTNKHVEFCFAVYDMNADGFITKDEMFQLLKNCLIKHPQEEDPDESVKDLVDIVMRKIDKDKDGKVSLEDFQATVDEEPLLLEAFGKCLPSERSKNTFLSTLKA
jgi:Ca2+-binding EF-hand superfamily protein